MVVWSPCQCPLASHHPSLLLPSLVDCCDYPTLPNARDPSAGGVKGDTYKSPSNQLYCWLGGAFTMSQPVSQLAVDGHAKLRAKQQTEEPSHPRARAKQNFRKSPKIAKLEGQVGGDNKYPELEGRVGGDNKYPETKGTKNYARSPTCVSQVTWGPSQVVLIPDRSKGSHKGSHKGSPQGISDRSEGSHKGSHKGSHQGMSKGSHKESTKDWRQSAAI